MKKSLLLLSAVLAAAFTAAAAEMPVENPWESMKKAWNDGSMIGKNTHAMYIKGQAYPDCWSYYYVESGLTPETAVFQPLNGINPDLVANSFWKKYAPIISAGLTKNGKSFAYPALVRGSIGAQHTNKTFGAAFAFKNPFKEDTICYIEGRLRHPVESKVFVYIKSADGKITHLTDSSKPGALYVVNTKHANGSIEVRNYLKLQIETKLKPGDSVFFAGFRSDYAGKRVAGKKSVSFLSVNDQWGKAFQPAISFEK